MYAKRILKYRKSAFRNLLRLAGFLVILSSCEKTNTYNNPRPPVIQSVSPESAAAGSTVYIYGENFSPRISDNSVMIGSAAVTLYSCDSTTLVILIPEGLESGPVKVTVNGVTTTGPDFTYIPTVTAFNYAGSGLVGLQDGTLPDARFNLPRALAEDADGNIYVADQLNHAIRKIDAGGQVSTFAGNGNPGVKDGNGQNAEFKQPDALIVGGDGNIYVADYTGNTIREISPGGEGTTIAGDSVAGYVDGPGSSARFNGPTGLAMDSQGNLFVSEFFNNVIRKITPAYQVSTYAGTGAIGADDNTRLQATFYGPLTLAMDKDGNLLIGDWLNFRIRKIDVEGNVSTLAGSTKGYLDGPALEAQFNTPAGLAFDAHDNLYVSDAFNNRIRMIDAEGYVSTFAGSTDADYVNGSPENARFNTPAGLVFDTAASTLYVADWYNYRVRKITIR